MMRRLLLILTILSMLLVAGLSLAAQEDTGDSVRQTDDGTIVIDTDEATEDLIRLTNEAATGIVLLMEAFLNNLYRLPRENDFVRVALTIGGVILLFTGWRFYDWIIVIAGAMIGAAAGLAIVGDTNIVIELVAFVIGGIIGAFLGAFVWYIAVAIIGAYVGLLAAVNIVAIFGITAPTATYVLLIGAVLGIILLLVLALDFLIIFGSLLGALLLTLGMVLDPLQWWVIGLAITGLFVQFYLTRRNGISFRRRPSRRILWR